MGNTCQSCDYTTSEIVFFASGHLDLQGEGHVVASYPDGAVVVSARARTLPRLALGQQDGSTEAQAGRSKVLFPNAAVLTKPSTEHSAKVEAMVHKMPMLESTKAGAPCLQMTFEVHGEEKKVQIFKRPLGAEFSKKAKGPTKVSKVHPQSYASTLGIRAGWVLRSIGGEDVCHKTFEETQEAIKSRMSVLPGAKVLMLKMSTTDDFETSK